MTKLNMVRCNYYEDLQCLFTVTRKGCEHFEPHIRNGLCGIGSCYRDSGHKSYVDNCCCKEVKDDSC